MFAGYDFVNVWLGNTPVGGRIVSRTVALAMQAPAGRFEAPSVIRLVIVR